MKKLAQREGFWTRQSVDGLKRVNVLDSTEVPPPLGVILDGGVIRHTLQVISLCREHGVFKMIEETSVFQ